MSSFNDRKDGVDSFWHLLFTSGLFSHWEYVQTWEVAELLPVSILEVYSLPARTPKKKMRQRWSVGFRSGLCCVSKMPKERAKREVEKSIFYFILKCFLYLSITQCPVVVFAVCNLLLFFTNSTGKHFSIVLFLGCCFFVFCFFFFFGADESRSLLDLFLGTSGFNLWRLYYKKRMLSKCLLVTYTPLPEHACMHFMFRCHNEKTLSGVFNKEQESWEETEWKYEYDCKQKKTNLRN